MEVRDSTFIDINPINHTDCVFLWDADGSDKTAEFDVLGVKLGCLTGKRCRLDVMQFCMFNRKKNSTKLWFLANLLRLKQFCTTPHGGTTVAYLWVILFIILNMPVVCRVFELMWFVLSNVILLERHLVVKHTDYQPFYFRSLCLTWFGHTHPFVSQSQSTIYEMKLVFSDFICWFLMMKIYNG